MKLCKMCDETKPLDQFYKDRGKPGGPCKSCSAIKTKAWVKANPQRRAMHQRKKNYGIDFEFQENLPTRCQICDTTEKLVVDHDHKTGKYRGVLCQNHNTGLGMFKDDPIMLLRAVDYLMGTLGALAVDQIKQSFGVKSVAKSEK